MSASTLTALALGSLLAASGPAPAPGPHPATDAPAASTNATVDAPRLVEATPPRWARRAKRMTSRERHGTRIGVGASAAVLSLFYITGTLVAAHNLDDIHRDGVVEASERNELRASALMFIPVVGPFAAAPMGETGGDKAGLAGYGIMQGLAAAALIGLSVQIVRDRRARKLSLMARPAPGGGTVAISGRF